MKLTQSLFVLATLLGLGITSALADCVDDCYDEYIADTDCPDAADPNAPITVPFEACVCASFFVGPLANYLSCVGSQCGVPSVQEFFGSICPQFNPSPSGVSRRGVQVNLPGSFSCPTGLTSCPIPEQFGQPLYERDMLEVPRMTGRTMHGECVDTMNDMDSCGGCATLGEGVQCGQVEGVRETACVAGKCQIFSCGYGYKLVMVNHPDGTAEQTCQRSLIGTLSPF